MSASETKKSIKFNSATVLEYRFAAWPCRLPFNTGGNRFTLELEHKTTLQAMRLKLETRGIKLIDVADSDNQLVNEKTPFGELKGIAYELDLQSYRIVFPLSLTVQPVMHFDTYQDVMGWVTRYRSLNQRDASSQVYLVTLIRAFTYMERRLPLIERSFDEDAKFTMAEQKITIRDFTTTFKLLKEDIIKIVKLPVKQRVIASKDRDLWWEWLVATCDLLDQASCAKPRGLDTDG